MRRKTSALALLLGALAMLGPFATDTYLPSFPTIARNFAVPEVEVQQTLSVYLFAYALMSLSWGTLSDSLGRRPVILVSLTLFCAGSVGCALSQSLPVLLGFRVMQGLSAGAGMVVGQAVVRDRLDGAAAQRLIAQIMMVFGLAPAIAPILGGWLQTAFGWRAGFGFMTLFSMILLIGCAATLSESLPAKLRQPLRVATVAHNYLSAVVHPQFLLRCLSVGCAFAGLGLYIAAAADFVLRVLNLPTTGFGWLFLPLIGGLVAGSSVNARLAHRVSGQSLIRAGFAIMMGATAIDLLYTFYLPVKIPWAVLPVSFYTFGLALSAPSMTMVTLGLFPTMRGLAASLQNFIQMFIFALMSGVVAPAVYGSACKLAGVVAAGLSLAAMLWAVANRSSKSVSAGLSYLPME